MLVTLLFTFGLAGLHLVRLLFILGLDALHLACAFLMMARVLFLFGVAWLRYI